jgi:glycosyltransferase involved in cell wall biosynthesis
VNPQNGKKFALTVVLAGRQQTGGGYHQALSNLRMLLRSIHSSVDVSVLDVRGTFEGPLRELQSEGLLEPRRVLTLPRRLESLRDRVVADRGLAYRLIRWFLRITGREIEMTEVTRFLDTSDCDLVYFASPFPEASQLQQKPFVWTLWDLCHLDSPEFPEVRTSGKFEEREVHNAACLRKASLVVVDSNELREKAERYYGANPEKFVVIPFGPSSTIVQGTKDAGALPPQISSLQRPYFFYPAQLWMHKNHRTIVEALALLDARGKHYDAVFVGKDHGAQRSLAAFIESIGMTERAHFLGYVADDVLPALYSGSEALVMASYFGPTNIPPLEAFLFRVPVIASNQHTDQLGEAAIFFDPDSAEELATAMEGVRNKAEKSRLVAAGAARLDDLTARRDQGAQELSEALLKLKKRLLL